MFNKVLVAYDGSECSKKALEQACKLINEDKVVQLHILTAFSLPTNQMFSLYGASMIEDIIEEYENEAQAYIEEAKIATGEYLDVCTFHILRGDPANAILHYSENQEIDLIIIGSRGLGTVKGILLGSVSSRVVQQADCNVLIVK